MAAADMKAGRRPETSRGGRAAIVRMPGAAAGDDGASCSMTIALDGDRAHLSIGPINSVEGGQ